MADPTYFTQDFNDLRLPGSPDPREVDKCIPRFFSQEVLKEDQLVRIEMVEIITPGDRLSRPIQRVTDQHRARWRQQYAAFKSGIDPTLQGTPIATWDALPWSMQNDLRSLGFQTIEQLAEASDNHLEQFPNGMMWRKKAQVHIESKRSVVDKDAELNELRARLAKLEAKENVSVLHESGPRDDRETRAGKSGGAPVAAKGRGPGRPRKSTAVGAVPDKEPASNAA